MCYHTEDVKAWHASRGSLMTNRRAHFRERDVARAIRAARKAGEKGEVRVVIEGGKLVVIACPPRGAEDADAEVNEWDGVGGSC